MTKSKFYPFNHYHIRSERKGICSICDGEMFHGINISKEGTHFLLGKMYSSCGVKKALDINICGECFLKIKEVYDRT